MNDDVKAPPPPDVHTILLLAKISEELSDAREAVERLTEKTERTERDRLAVTARFERHYETIEQIMKTSRRWIYAVVGALLAATLGEKGTEYVSLLLSLL